MPTKTVNHEAIKKHIIRGVNAGGNVSNELLTWLEVAVQNELWRNDCDFDGKPFTCLVEWLTYSPPPGCGVPEIAESGSIEITLSQIIQYAEQHSRQDIVKHLGVPKRKTDPRNKNLPTRVGKSRVKTGRSACRKSTLLTRLMEEHPKVYEKYLQGHFNSVRAAAEAAGLVKPGHDPLMRLKAYWNKADKAQRKEFLKWIETA